MPINYYIFAADPLRRIPLPEFELAIRCLGAVVFYLRYCLSDTEILSLGLIREYSPVDVSTESLFNRQPFYERQVHMVSRVLFFRFMQFQIFIKSAIRQVRRLGVLKSGK